MWELIVWTQANTTNKLSEPHVKGLGTTTKCVQLSVAEKKKKTGNKGEGRGSQEHKSD